MKYYVMTKNKDKGEYQFYMKIKNLDYYFFDRTLNKKDRSPVIERKKTKFRLSTLNFSYCNIECFTVPIFTGLIINLWHLAKQKYVSLIIGGIK